MFHVGVAELRRRTEIQGSAVPIRGICLLWVGLGRLDGLLFASDRHLPHMDVLGDAMPQHLREVQPKHLVSEDLFGAHCWITLLATNDKGAPIVVVLEECLLAHGI